MIIAVAEEKIHNGVVEFYDANGNYTGTRSAMTQQDMYMWNAIYQQEIAEQQNDKSTNVLL